ncbi:EamA family transporter RarD [Salinicoccus halodurans]|uniref:Chloramphenicol-sensitive protein RarD n=1 Tax=Salinicoccus halodurans TaxID=407035 RepID=A0A0F7HLL7_9STAP|nr:EamA family transporter RarD [Salinicoccus halodurans]AKG74846.1 transporter [Salinicoccus halodurans]SFK69517.1 chloramphenicol-sensitive protein RarD [Salinicoccus halodurans]
MSENTKGILFALGAYIIWGFLPIYWKQIEHISPYEIIAHRVFWSFIFMIVFIIVTNRLLLFKKDLKFIFKDKKKVAALFFASCVITSNWLVYIIAVNTGHILDASLGYYINPLISILFGLVLLGERFSKIQWGAIIIVFAGVTYLAVGLGAAPWISLYLATSFSVYGLIKKVVNLDAIFALAVETFVLAPFALVYIFFLEGSGQGNFGLNIDSLIMMGTGVATAIPLLLFALGAQRIRLSLIGFLQYFAPTIMLIIGVFMYDESFTDIHKVAYILIWSGLLLYTISRFLQTRRQSAKNARRRVSG